MPDIVNPMDNTQLLVTLPVDLREHVRQLSSRMMVSQSSFVRSALRSYIATIEGMEAPPVLERKVQPVTACDRLMPTLRIAMEGDHLPMPHYQVMEALMRRGFSRRTIAQGLSRLVDECVIEIIESARGPMVVQGTRHSLAGAAPAEVTA